MRETPLFLTRIECPVCGTVNEYETIRVGAYTEGERDTDFCPSYIKWRNPKYQRFHPLLFFTAACSHCHYTREFNGKFKDWSHDNNFRTYRLKSIKEKHLSNLAAADSFIKLVGGFLDQENYPDETAVLKLLLAAFDELLNEHPSHLDLGRFYLRVAWLFRHSGSGPEEAPVVTRPRAVEDIERAIGDISTWTAGFGRNIEYLQESIAAYAEKLAASDDDRIPLPELQAAVDRLSEIQAECENILRGLETRLSTLKTSADVAVSLASGTSFHDYASFGEFLVKLARVWDGVPRNETEAIQFAVKYYMMAFEAGKEIAHGNQAIQAAYLIAELSRRTGDHDMARQYFNKTIKMGQEFINEIRGDRTRTALAKKLLELALAQGKRNLAEAK